MRNLSSPISTIRLTIFGGLLFAAAVIPRAQADTLKVFQVLATSTNISGPAMTIDNPITNRKPGALLIVTQYWAGVYNPHPVGVFYDTTSAKWQIVNEDLAAMPVNARFNVRVAQPTATRTFEFIATGLNSGSDYSVINRSATNGKPAALLLATHYINANHLFASYLPAPIGVLFNAGDKINKWSIYNEDRSSAIATCYFVANITKEKNVSSQTSDHMTAVGDTFYISDPVADGNPNAVIFVTHDYGAAQEFQNHPVGVYYTGTEWAIFNEDVATFAVGETFNIEVFAGPVPPTP